MENPRAINNNLVDAAHARAIKDKFIGYKFSGMCPGKSVGRCQTAFLKILVDREREILNFKPEQYIDLYLLFNKNNVDFKATYQGTDANPIKHLKNQDDVDAIAEQCKGNPFIVKSIEKKDRKENPKNPFSTATILQECANKLGLSVKSCTDCLQALYDKGYISYIRSDSEYFSPEFEKELKEFVLKKYGKTYASGTVTKGKVDDTAQEAHEGIHVLDLELTPELAANKLNNDLYTKVYRIIYNRTIASALKPAIIAQTTYNIYNNEHRFTLTSNELSFDGYRVVYNYKDDEDEKEDIVKETFEKGECLNNCSLESVLKETTPPSRFKEASAVNIMKKEGIGRPSTYSSILQTILSESRGYVKIVDKYLVPTDVGMNLIDFTDKNFPDIFNVEYTRAMEKDLSDIAEGKAKYLESLKTFHAYIEESAKKVLGATSSDKVCSKCGKPMVIRKGRYGPFYACSGYPECKNIESIKKKS